MLSVFTFSACNNPQETTDETAMEEISPNQKKLNEYVEFTLTSDLSKLSENQRKMIPLLIQVAEIMDDIFWKEAYGDKNALLNSLTKPEDIAFCKINYGPWDRLGDNAPFIEGVGEKPLGAQYYPLDMSVAEFEAWDDETKSKTILYLDPPYEKKEIYESIAKSLSGSWFKGFIWVEADSKKTWEHKKMEEL